MKRHPIEDEALYHRELDSKLKDDMSFRERQEIMHDTYNRHTLPLIEQKRFEILRILSKELSRLLRMTD